MTAHNDGDGNDEVCWIILRILLLNQNQSERWNSKIVISQHRWNITFIKWQIITSNKAHSRVLGQTLHFEPKMHPSIRPNECRLWGKRREGGAA